MPAGVPVPLSLHILILPRVTIVSDMKDMRLCRLPRSSVGRAGSSEGETANPLLSRVQNLVRATGSDGRGRCAAKRKPSKSTSTTDISWESHLTDSACGSTRQRPARCTRWADGRMWLSEGGQFPTIHHPTTCAQTRLPLSVPDDSSRRVNRVESLAGRGREAHSAEK